MTEYIEREAAINAVFGAMADGRAVFPALNNLPAADVREVKWIPVTERLPEGAKDVLVWVSIGKAPIVAYDVDSYNERAKRWVRFENDVTHWMPLPQPPKEE